MRDEDFGDLRGGNVSVKHLPLCAFARIKEKTFRVPTQKIAVMIALARRNLARRAERDESSCRHKKLR